MNAISLLEEIQRMGITLKAVGDKLRFRPVDAVDQETLELLKAHKAELLASLRSRDARPSNACRLTARPNRQGFDATDVFDGPQITPHSKRAPGAWPSELTDLIEWFQANREGLPTSPYRLLPGVRVIEAERFYCSLERDIMRGPSGPRARFGGLLHDLAALRRNTER